MEQENTEAERQLIKYARLCRFIGEHGVLAPAWCAFCADLPAGSFPAFAALPLVSIIIPAHNNWELTQICLKSIRETCDASIPFEVILVDDCSTDGTREAVSLFPGLHVVRMPQNGGFIRACNEGARQARGNYILFLNNDTAVYPNWLRPLYELMEADDRAAIVGSKMYYLDGRVQDTGSFLWNDGSAGRYEEFGEITSHLTFVREVDYMAGCSILVRGTFWRESNGFDEHFGKGYFEDVDLALQARSRGYRILFQPASRLVHREHASFGVTAHEQIRNNLLLLKKKWGELLGESFLPPSVPAHRALAHACSSLLPDVAARREKDSPFNILFYAPYVTEPTEPYNARPLVERIRQLQSWGNAVHVVAPRYITPENCHAEILKFADSLTLLDYYADYIYAKTPDANVPFDSWHIDAMGGEVMELCVRKEIDIVLCAHAFASKILDYVPEYILKLIDAYDILGERFFTLQQAGLSRSFFSCSREDEKKYLERADTIMVQSAAAAEYMEKLSIANEVLFVGRQSSEMLADREFLRVGHVGLPSCKEDVDLIAVERFILAVQKALGDTPCPFLLNVAWSTCTDWQKFPPVRQRVFTLPFVRLKGNIDPAQFYADQDVVVVPSAVWTGSNSRTIQAFSYGLPVLTTFSGSKGTGSVNAFHLHSDEDFTGMARTLLDIAAMPEKLPGLAQESVRLFAAYAEQARGGWKLVAGHPKLRISSAPPCVSGRRQERYPNE